MLAAMLFSTIIMILVIALWVRYGRMFRISMEPQWNTALQAMEESFALVRYNYDVYNKIRLYFGSQCQEQGCFKVFSENPTIPLNHQNAIQPLDSCEQSVYRNPQCSLWLCSECMSQHTCSSWCSKDHTF